MFDTHYDLHNHLMPYNNSSWNSVVILNECTTASNLLQYAVPLNNHYTFLPENFNLLRPYSLFPSSFLSLPLSSSCALFHTFISERDCAPLQCFYKGCKQSNQQLTLSRLMHDILYCSSVFPYQVLERRQVQETLTCCERQCNKNDSITRNTHHS